MFKKLLIFNYFLFAVASLKAQENNPDSSTVKSPVIKLNSKAPRPYKDVISKNAITQKGLFAIHTIADTIYFELPDSLLGRDILSVRRIAQGGTQMRDYADLGYGGDDVGTGVIRFEKGPKDKIFMRNISYLQYSKDSTMPMYRSVMRSNLQPINYAFDIKAYHKDSLDNSQSGSVINVTELLNGDNELFFLDGAQNPYKFLLGLGAYQPDKSYMVSIKAFPNNTEIKTIKTYAKMPLANGQSMGPNANTFSTIELNTSLILLPKVPMQKRMADNRVGYFVKSFTDFDKDPQAVVNSYPISRWRLEPKDEDKEKYFRGELVEPKKPIVIYIDPATPEKWIPYLILGVNDWQVAFEKAGFKNAIIGKRAPGPEEDSTWSLEDGRHSAIVYKPSSTPNAMGPHIADPRTGEILETHIYWFHNVMKLVHDWFLIQSGAVYPGARKMEFDDELMGQLIRFVSSHEVGHTLGLRHNFGASSATPVEKLRDKKWVEANGHTVSIMDYARFNYVAQPEDSIGLKGIFPRIGDYDKWAIEWGYKLLPDSITTEKEQPILNKWVIEKSKDPKYFFGRENNADDPHSQNEDLSDNAIKAGEYGIKNLKVVVKNLVNWTKIPNGDYENLGSIYIETVKQFNQYVLHVQKNIGGRYEIFKTTEQQGNVYSLVPRDVQKDAVDFLNKNVFTTPTWLIDSTIIPRIDIMATTVMGYVQTSIGLNVINLSKLNNMVRQEAYYGKSAYSVQELLSDLQKSIWVELNTKQPVDLFKQNLQNKYTNKFLSVVLNKGNASLQNENYDIVVSILRDHLQSLKKSIHAAIPMTADPVTKRHYRNLEEEINKINSKNNLVASDGSVKEGETKSIFDEQIKFEY